MKKYLNKVLLLLAICIVALPGLVIRDIVEGQVVSGPVSYSKHEKLFAEETISNTEYRELLDPSTGVLYYTEKDGDTWGSSEHIFIKSLSENKVIRKIKFDNSGYFKYPLAISPDSKYLILAESAQSVGEVKLFIVNLKSETMNQIKDKVYSPLLKWVSNTEYVYLTTEIECSDNRGCKQQKILVKKGGINSETRVISTIEKNKASERLPVINELRVEGSRISYKDSESNHENQIDSELNINTSL